jgi:hypothetical protein
LLSDVYCLLSAVCCFLSPTAPRFPHAIRIWHCCAQYQALYWAPLYTSLFLNYFVNSLLGIIHSCLILSHLTPNPTFNPFHPQFLTPTPQPQPI